MSNFYSSAAQILPPKSPVYNQLGSQTDLQAATRGEEEEEEEPSGDCAGPCLHSKILYLGATIRTHRPAVSIGLEICSCQRTPEKKYRKQQLAAKGISFCCCSRSFVIFHFTFLAFEENGNPAKRARVRWTRSPSKFRLRYNHKDLKPSNASKGFRIGSIRRAGLQMFSV